MSVAGSVVSISIHLLQLFHFSGFGYQYFFLLPFEQEKHCLPCADLTSVSIALSLFFFFYYLLGFAVVIKTVAFPVCA